MAPKPVNVLVGSDFATVAELADLGVRRISVGGALARAAWGGFLEAAREIAERGTFGAAGAGGAVRRHQRSLRALTRAYIRTRRSASVALARMSRRSRAAVWSTLPG